MFLPIIGGHLIKPLEASFTAASFAVDGLFRAGPRRLLHFEYMRRPTPELVARMLVYRGMIMRRHPRDLLVQHVIVLGEGTLTGYQDLRRGFMLDLRVSYLREMSPDSLLRRRATAPLAVLTRGSRTQRAGYLEQALALIGNADDTTSTTLREVAAVMATIRLDAPTIEHVMKESGMSSESIAEFYRGTGFGQELLAEGRQEGRQEGRESTLAAVLAIMIRGKFGDTPEIELVARRLARLDEAEALSAVESAPTFEDLLALP